MAGSKLTTIALILAVASLSACTTVKMPDLDIFKSSDFENETANLGDYPDVTDAPAVPDDVRSAKRWDKQARSLIAKRDQFETPRPVEKTRTDAEIARDTEVLKARARAYKADDPQ